MLHEQRPAIQLILILLNLGTQYGDIIMVVTTVFASTVKYVRTYTLDTNLVHVTVILLIVRWIIWNLNTPYINIIMIVCHYIPASI